MIIFKDWFIFLGGVGLLVCKGDVVQDRPIYEISPARIRPGEHATLTIKVRAAEKAFVPKIQDDLLLGSKQIHILKKDEKPEGRFQAWQYQMTAYRPGYLLLPPLEIQVGPHSFSTEGISLEVISPRAPGDEELRPEYGPISFPWRWQTWAKAFMAAVFLLGLLTVLNRWVKRRRKQLPSEQLIPRAPVEDDLVWLRKRLRLLQERLSKGDSDEALVDELTHTLKEYFARRWKAPVETWTTREFRTHFTQDKVATKLSAVFEDCDEYKFKQKTDTDARNLIRRCLNESELLLCGS